MKLISNQWRFVEIGFNSTDFLMEPFCTFLNAATKARFNPEKRTFFYICGFAAFFRK